MKQDLEEARAALLASVEDWKVWLRHLIPDYVMYAYSIDVVEQSGVVASLDAITFGRAAIANARAAYEAALDMLLLMADEDQYDERGAFARVSELVELEDLEVRHDTAIVQLALPERAQLKSPEDAIAEDVELWRGEWPEAKEVLERCLATVRKDGRWKRHWSGMGRKQIASHLELAYSQGNGMAAMIDSTYGAISYQSHPRPRIGARDVEWTASTLNIGPRDKHLRLAQSITTLACQLATRALNRRVEWADERRVRDGV